MFVFSKQWVKLVTIFYVHKVLFKIMLTFGEIYWKLDVLVLIFSKF